MGNPYQEQRLARLHVNELLQQAQACHEERACRERTLLDTRARRSWHPLLRPDHNR
jgi:hypothetical protein